MKDTRPGGNEGKKGESMKQGIEISWSNDFRGKSILKITKRRGKLTLEEIGDLLRYENGQRLCGHYAIILNCSEDTMGGNGLYFEEDQKGDAVALYPIEEVEDCPVCGAMLPPFNYCQNCGTAWKDTNLNIETLIASMRDETERMIQEAARHDGKTAWYWSYIGALDMARQLGLITDERRQELYKDVEELKPKPEETEVKKL